MRACKSLLWGLAAFLLTVYSGLAFSQVTPQAYWQVGSSSGAVKYASAEAACRSTFEKYGASYQFHSAVVTNNQAPCYYKLNNGSPTLSGTMYRYSCSATTPYLDPTGQTCTGTPSVDPNRCADKNPIVRRFNYPGGGPYTAPTNFSGCVVEPIEMMVCRKAAVGSYCMWMVKRTGADFNGTVVPGAGGTSDPEVPSDPPVKSPPIESPPKVDDAPGKNPCPTGTVHAGMSASGIPMCIGTGTTPPAKPVQPKVETEKNETGADGSTTNTKTVITTNTDGSTTKTVTVTVTKADGTKETSGTASTSATPSGAAGKTDKGPEDDKYDLCKTNPNLAICREGSVTGTCGQIQCVGDAIQCATLRAAAAMECKQRTDEDLIKASPIHSLGNAAINGNDPKEAELPKASRAQVVDVTGIAADGWLGGGAAFDDVVFSIMGKSITIPFAKWSGYLVGLRYALMVVASLVSFRILSGAILRS